MKPMKQSLFWYIVNSFPKVYKTIEDFQRTMTGLLYNGLECKDVVSGLVLCVETVYPMALKCLLSNMFEIYRCKTIAYNFENVCLTMIVR